MLTWGFLVFGLCTITVNDDVWRPAADRIRRALWRADLSHKEAAQLQGLTEGQWSNQLAGREAMAMHRLELLPARFHAWHALLRLLDVGLPTEVRRAARVALAVSGVKRMARVKWAPPEDKQRTA